MIYGILNFLYYDFSGMILPAIFGVSLGPGGYLLSLIIVSVLVLAFFAVYYTFRSIGLYKMAKKSGLVKPYLALIPFFGIYVCYRLSPNSKYIKKQTAICVLAIVFGALLLLVNCLIDGFYAIPAIIDLVKLNRTMADTGAYHMVPGSIFSFNSTILTLLQNLLSIVNLVYTVFMVIVYSRLFMSYSLKPAKMTIFSALVCYFAGTFLLAGIFVYALRNKPRIDYDSYIEAKRSWEQKVRYGNPFGNNQYGGNQYGGPYGNPFYGNQQGYGGFYGNQQNPNENNFGGQSEIDPFEEFSSPSNNQGQEDQDDIFNL